MDPIKGTYPSKLIEEASAELLEEQRQAGIKEIKSIFCAIKNLSKEIKQLSAELAKKEAQLKSKQDLLYTIKEGDWSAINLNQ